jgi:magnesium-transporting ATPase (P-type)
VLGEVQEYELLAILDFNNVRKRMSVIIRKDGRIFLYCKGADSVVFERLDPKCARLKEITNKNLNRFAAEGLRTLCLAKKEISESLFEVFRRKLHLASIALESREDKVNAVYEEIEQNLILIGATAIEDKLQDGVPATIANLSAAGIKIWVLTGDKQETAINIGYSCQLLTDEMSEVFTIEGWEFDVVEKEMRKCRSTIEEFEQQLERKQKSLAPLPAPISFQPATPLSSSGRLSIISHAQSYTPSKQMMPTAGYASTAPFTYQPPSRMLAAQPTNGLLTLPHPARVTDANNNYLQAGSMTAIDSFDGLQSPGLMAALNQAGSRSSVASNSKNVYAKTGLTTDRLDSVAPDQSKTADGDSPGTGNGSFALVINGHSLVHALQPSMQLLFLEVASKCNAVICCRVTPLQKAMVVDLVKMHKKAVTLAIGDGANDVSMIKSKIDCRNFTNLTFP